MRQLISQTISDNKICDCCVTLIQRSISVLFVVCHLTACCHVNFDPTNAEVAFRESKADRIGERRSLIWVAAIDSNMADHVDELFERHGVYARIHGSIVFGVYVKEDDASQSIRLLTRDATEHGYWIDFGAENIDANLRPQGDR